jgi:hypothetical protein
MFAVASAILFAIALVLHLMNQSAYTVDTFMLSGLLALALACIPGLRRPW